MAFFIGKIVKSQFRIGVRKGAVDDWILEHQGVRGAKAARRVNLNDALSDAELSAIALAKLRSNGNGSHPERVLCDCPESLINGRRVAVHRVTDCLYCRERSKLVESAATAATIRVGDPELGGKELGYKWTRVFTEVMQEFSEPLLQSNKGVGEHRAAWNCELSVERLHG